MADFVWNFEEKGFDKIPDGDYRVQIKSADKAFSKAGNEMLVLEVLVSGTSKIIKHYITFLPDKRDVTNRSLTSLFNSFGIQYGNFDLNSYIGKAGAAHIETPAGEEWERIKFFISGKRKDDLPPWGTKPKMTAAVDNAETSDLDNEIPF